MRGHDWKDVWTLFLNWMSHQTIPIQIAIGLGAAFVAVMALEGVRASFFPKRILESAVLRRAMPMPVKSAAPQEEPDTAWNENEAEPLPLTVNAMTGSEAARRSGPQPLRVIGQRKPS